MADSWLTHPHPRTQKCVFRPTAISLAFSHLTPNVISLTRSVAFSAIYNSFHAQTTTQWPHNAGFVESEVEFQDIYGLDDDVCVHCNLRGYAFGSLTRSPAS